MGDQEFVHRVDKMRQRIIDQQNAIEREFFVSAKRVIQFLLNHGYCSTLINCIDSANCDSDIKKKIKADVDLFERERLSLEAEKAAKPKRAAKKTSEPEPVESVVKLASQSDSDSIDYANFNSNN